MDTKKQPTNGQRILAHLAREPDMHKLPGELARELNLDFRLIYPLLDALEQAQLVASYWLRVGDLPHGCYYRISEQGLKTLKGTT